MEYTANKKTWMTGALFEDWMKKLDRRMRLEGRHIALLVDNGGIDFFSPNTASVTANGGWHHKESLISLLLYFGQKTSGKGG